MQFSTFPELSAKDFQPYPELQELHVVDSLLTALTDDAYMLNPNLEKLFLTSNRLTEIPQFNYTGLKEL